jgi:hypothetical protein
MPQAKPGLQNTDIGANVTSPNHSSELRLYPTVAGGRTIPFGDPGLSPHPLHPAQSATPRPHWTHKGAVCCSADSLWFWAKARTFSEGPKEPSLSWPFQASPWKTCEQLEEKEKSGCERRQMAQDCSWLYFFLKRIQVTRTSLLVCFFI